MLRKQVNQLFRHFVCDFEYTDVDLDAVLGGLHLQNVGYISNCIRVGNAIRSIIEPLHIVMNAADSPRTGY